MAPSSDPMAALTADGTMMALPLRGHVALRLVDVAMLMLRVTAILVLLSPLLAAAILLG